MKVEPDDVLPPGGALSRRDLLVLLGSGAVASALPACRVWPPASNASDHQPPLAEPLQYSSVRALASSIRNGDVSSEEVVRAYLDRIEDVNDALNAVVQSVADRALARAREADAALAREDAWGPLHGVPMTIKDSLDTAGVITTGGTEGRASFVPERDATVVARLREAGAILLGKTNTPELTLSSETDNAVYGRTNNPYDLSRTPGGSSGGSAAIVAAGGAPFDIGSDYGGSIRFPAHYCGVAGIKPSAGRVPRTGHVLPFGGIQDSFQQIGPIARYVDDLVLLLPLIAGPDWVDPGIVPLPWHDPHEIALDSLRVSFHSDNGIMAPTAETIGTVEAVARSLESNVLSVDQARPPGIEDSWNLIMSLHLWDRGARIERLLRAAGTTRPASRTSESDQMISAVEVDRLIEEWYSFRSEMHSFMGRYDAILCPASGSPALPHGATTGDGVAVLSYTGTYNLVGWPGVTVRAGTSAEGLPIGVQIVARPGREDVALALAESIEAMHGGYERPTIA